MKPSVSLLIILFGMGSWIAINGVWAELPLLVSKLPEKWDLPTYLVLIIQVANIGPIIFTIMRQYKRDLASLRYTAYLILLIGFAAAILLSQLWDKEVKIGSKQSSLPLLFLSFLFALVDCTSSVVFLPFMAKYPSSYMIPFYIGEGMSGVMPSLLALAQGTGGDTCYDASGSASSDGPRFGVNVYFGLVSALTAVSGIAFYFLNNLDVSLNERYDNIAVSSTLPAQSPDQERAATPEDTAPSALDPSETKLANIRVYDVFCGERRSELVDTKWNFIQLYTIIAIVSALGNGVIPAILSYACLPYGPTAYHLATELALLTNPICCFLAFFIACKRPPVLGVLCSVSVFIATVIIYTATLSPTPWLVGTGWGSFLIVLLSILWTGSTSYIKVNVACVLQKYGENTLLFCGIVTQLGSCLGAVIIFLVNFKTNSFTSC